MIPDQLKFKPYNGLLPLMCCHLIVCIYFRLSLINTFYSDILLYFKTFLNMNTIFVIEKVSFKTRFGTRIFYYQTLKIVRWLLVLMYLLHAHSCCPCQHAFEEYFCILSSMNGIFLNITFPICSKWLTIISVDIDCLFRNIF